MVHAAPQQQARRAPSGMVPPNVVTASMRPRDRRRGRTFDGRGTVAAMDAQALATEALDAVTAASTLDELDEVRVRYLGRKSALKLALREVRDRETGLDLNAVRERIEAAVADRRQALEDAVLEEALAEEAIDVTRPGQRPARGHLHLITQIRREVEDVFLGLGYEVIDGREVETTHYNFDGLAFPFWHPARSPHNSLFLDEQTLLRTETSPSQIRVMEERRPPVYMISHGRVYRRDTIDATHYPIFHQVEGLAVDRGITLADLKGTLLALMRALFGEDREVRFRTHYFPFTEPSMEPDVSCFLCAGEGCRTCRFSGWIEMGGSGMVDPAVLEFVGYDPEEFSGFAFGLGLERMAQLRHGVPDIRLLWQSDLRVLSQF
jgi:phenylalanyl-tRNA synthetase alpha chain